MNSWNPLRMLGKFNENLRHCWDISSETETFVRFPPSRNIWDADETLLSFYWCEGETNEIACFSFLAHSQRLVSVQSMLRQTGRYRTLERDLMELQERKLFEYFLVVALHKTKAGVPYLPEVTQQFPLKVKSQICGFCGNLNSLVKILFLSALAGAKL